MLAERFRLEAIFVEVAPAQPSFDTEHPYEAQRDAFERDVLLKGRVRTLKECAPVRYFESVNMPEAVAALRSLEPDVVLVFGTGKLLPPVMQVPSRACLNLHGGNPEHYRGLDSHLWAIYHKDFGNLVTTLHHVDEGLDSGAIVFQSEITLGRGTALHELRGLNTEVGVRLSMLALQSLEAMGWLPFRRQVSRGRYYSFMPGALKEECVRKFRAYTEHL